MKNLIKKLFAAKRQIGRISKDSTNPFYKSKYFDINDLLEHVESVLEEHRLIVLQPIINNAVVTQIFDAETGEKIESAISLPELNDPQKLGSAVTYYRRYTLQSLLSLQAEDDDGNKASKQTKEASKNEPEKWLNAYKAKDKKEFTDEFRSAYKAMHEGVDGKIYTIGDIRKKYKVSKETEGLLKELKTK